MPNHNTPLDTVLVQDIDTMDLTDVDPDVQIDIMLIQLDTVVSALEHRGCDMQAIDAALFSMFVSRLAERGDRDSFDSYVEEASEDTWNTIMIH
jgi:hypothetical protein